MTIKKARTQTQDAYALKNGVLHELKGKAYVKIQDPKTLERAWKTIQKALAKNMAASTQNSIKPNPSITASVVEFEQKTWTDQKETIPSMDKKVGQLTDIGMSVLDNSATIRRLSNELALALLSKIEDTPVPEFEPRNYGFPSLIDGMGCANQLQIEAIENLYKIISYIEEKL
jgi:hypothetical protein